MSESLLSWKRQPWKGIYVTFSYLDLLLLRVPCWSIRNLFPAWRPRSSWSLYKTLRVNLLRFVNGVKARVGGFVKNPTYRALEGGRGVLGLYIDGVPKLVTGDVKRWADFAGVQAVRLPGYWMHKKGENLKMGQAPAAGEKIIYFLHGGGYTALSAHPHSPVATVARHVLNACPKIRRCFAIEYRLSSTDPNPRENPFPAAIIDALAGYNYLVRTVGVSPKDIVVVGDSAGGNLALALARYLVTNQGNSDVKDLPAPPGRLVLLSPWADLGSSHCMPGSSMHTCKITDFIDGTQDDGTQGYGPRAYAGPQGMKFASENVYISPASKWARDVSFKDFPRTFISAGDAETLLDMIRELHKRMIVDLGEDVVYHEEKDAFHDYVGFPWFEPQLSNTLKKVAKFVSAP